MEIETTNNSGEDGAAEKAGRPTFDFDAAPAPPGDFSPRLQWNHRDWDKIGKEYVSSREVRESFLDCLGFWPKLEAPILLDRELFRKFCYYAETMEDMQADDHPEGYVPISYEGDEEKEEEWKQRQLGERYNRQYRSHFLRQMLSGTKNPVESKKNQYYIKAVKTCRPDAIQVLFDKTEAKKAKKGKEDNGTNDTARNVLDPNCFEGRGQVRRGVLAYALDNLYGPKASSANHPKAIECLRLVCSREGVDVSLDSWYSSSMDGPPLVQAITNLDVEAVRILLNAGARHSFPDATSIHDQWCNVITSLPEKYQTGLHRCVGMSLGNPDIFVHHGTEAGLDQDMHDILEMLLTAGADVLVEAPTNEPETTALQILEARQRATEEDYPRSMALLKNAEAKANERARNTNSSNAGAHHSMMYQPTIVLESGCWAQINDLDDSMRLKISCYADIYQWGMLKQTSKLLASWPKPPPPPVTYQLISFSFSNCFDKGYCGVAKSLPAVIDAFKSTAELDEDLLQNGDASIDIEFIQFNDDANCRIVPLLQYRQSDYCQDPKPANIHPFGRKCFGVKRSGDKLPYSLRKLLAMNVGFYYDDGEHSETKMVLEKRTEAAMQWFDGLKPSRDINLRHLWRTEGVDEDEDTLEMNEIWLNPDLCNESMFTFGSDGNWAVSDYETHLWDTC